MENNTLELKAHRRWFKDKYTIGDFYADGEKWCNTLEDKVRPFGPKGEGKVFGKTAIPVGRYEVIVSYSPKFGGEYPELLNVPFFSKIRIHSVVDENDTEGCIGVGFNKEVGKLTGGREIRKRLVALIKEKKAEGIRTFITIF